MTKRTISMIAISLAVAIASSGLGCSTSPPVAEAAMGNGIDVAEIVVPKGMPSFDDTYRGTPGCSTL